MKEGYEKFMSLIGKQKRYWLISFKALDSNGNQQDIQTYSKYLGEFLCNQCVVHTRYDLGNTSKRDIGTTLAEKFYKKVEKVVQIGYVVKITGFKLITDKDAYFMEIGEKQ